MDEFQNNEITDDEIDLFEIQELADEHRSLQCYKCAGWAVDCPCEDNQFSKQEKDDFRRLN